MHPSESDSRLKHIFGVCAFLINGADQRSDELAQAGEFLILACGGSVFDGFLNGVRGLRGECKT